MRLVYSGAAAHSSVFTVLLSYLVGAEPESAETEIERGAPEEGHTQRAADFCVEQGRFGLCSAADIHT